eukprot:5793757-Pyramimonas_sp.AAC.1
MLVRWLIVLHLLLTFRIQQRRMRISSGCTADATSTVDMRRIRGAAGFCPHAPFSHRGPAANAPHPHCCVHRALK